MKNQNLLLFCSLLSFSSLFQACKNNANEEKDNHSDIQFNLPDGFVLEDLYSPNDKDQGSWVALTEGPNQLMYVCDQNGDIYNFKLPAAGQGLDSTMIKSVDLPIGNAHGLLWA